MSETLRKVLVLSDASCGITGFSVVAYNLLKSIQETGLYEIVQIGINYDGAGYDNKAIPYQIVPASSGINPRYNDLYGRARVLDALASGTIDILFMLQDMSIVSTFMKEVQNIYDKLPKDKKFTTIFYTPVDSSLRTKRDWVLNTASLIDYPVVYTEFGKKEMLKWDENLEKRLRVCYHGVDTNSFYPLPPEKVSEIRRSVFKGLDFSKRFLILNVNRNQVRKDLMKTFKTMEELKKTNPEAMLIMFCDVDDQGGHLTEIAAQCGLTLGKDWVVPEKRKTGFSTEKVNEVYNISNCVFSSTIGEGWGLSSTEALATRKPCVFPDNTSLTEIFGGDKNRGRLVKSGSTPDQFVCYGSNDSSLVRPTIDVMDAVDKLKWVMEGGKEVEDMVDRGYEWVKTLDWSIINKFWISLFDKAWERVRRDRGLY